MSNLRFPVALWDDLNFPIIQRATGSTIAAYTAIDTGGVLLYPPSGKMVIFMCATATSYRTAGPKARRFRGICT
jgi:hypothetical protein